MDVHSEIFEENIWKLNGIVKSMYLFTINLIVLKLSEFHILVYNYLYVYSYMYHKQILVYINKIIR
jgi:hypothetical protein